ncbi:MAG: hypothetical protein AAF353_10080 [Pseudomonadota bacterium]
MKLVQKIFLRETREYEIVDDVVQIRIKSFLKEEKLTVALSMINPEPLENGSFLEFHSRVKCGPLLSLLINRPDARSFELFVDEIKRCATAEYNAFAGLKANASDTQLGGNSFEEPPDFDEAKKPQLRSDTKAISLASLESSIKMLETHLDGDQIRPLLTALEAMKARPESSESFDQLVDAFNGLGAQQGAVLTYAPYVSVLLSDDPFGY